MKPGRAGLLTAALSFAALGAAGCGTAHVSQKDLQSKVASYLQAQTGEGAPVTCPKDLTGDKGEKFTCTTALAGRTTDLDFQFSQKGKFRLLETRLE